MIIMIIIIIIIIIEMTVILERPSMYNRFDALNKCKYKNIKHILIRHPKQHVSKQSCSNVQLPYPHASMGMLWEWLGEPVLFWVEGF